MRYEISFTLEATQDLRRLRASSRTAIRDAIEKHLRFDPKKTSKSRIKRLRGKSRPQFRLRVDDIRIFYDVYEETVEILAIVAKSEAGAWLESAGEQE